LIADTIITLIIGKQRARGSLVTEDILRTLAHEAVKEGVVDNREVRFIDQLFDFSHKSVAEVMIPRSAIFYLPVEMPLFIVDDVDHYRIRLVLFERKKVKADELKFEIEHATATVNEETTPASIFQGSEESAQKSEALASIATVSKPKKK
jgi:Mg2+/Co2+ transporter CorB